MVNSLDDLLCTSNNHTILHPFDTDNLSEHSTLINSVNHFLLHPTWLPNPCIQQSIYIASEENYFATLFIVHMVVIAWALYFCLLKVCSQSLSYAFMLYCIWIYACVFVSIEIWENGYVTCKYIDKYINKYLYKLLEWRSDPSRQHSRCYVAWVAGEEERQKQGKVKVKRKWWVSVQFSLLIPCEEMGASQ